GPNHFFKVLALRRIQREEAMLSIVSLGLVALAAQYAPGKARILVCDGSAPDSPQREYLEKVIRAIPHNVSMVKQGDLPEIMGSLVEEMKRRNEEASEEATPVFVFIHGLQKFNKLRYEEDFGFTAADPSAPANPSVSLNTLLTE